MKKNFKYLLIPTCFDSDLHIEKIVSGRNILNGGKNSRLKMIDMQLFKKSLNC